MNNEHQTQKIAGKYNIRGFEHLPKPDPYSLAWWRPLRLWICSCIQHGPCHPLRELSQRGNWIREGSRGEKSLRELGEGEAGGCMQCTLQNQISAAARKPQELHQPQALLLFQTPKLFSAKDKTLLDVSPSCLYVFNRKLSQITIGLDL